jgi:phospholipid transport system substrate-binding protein
VIGRLGFALAVVTATALGTFLAPAAIPPASAATSDEAAVDTARELIVNFGDRTIGALMASDMSAEQRATELGKAMFDAVDFEYVARFALGRGGRNARGTLFKEFTQLFATHVVDLAADRLVEMDIRGYTITKTKQMPNGDVIVSTEIKQGAGEPFEAAWRVRQRDGRYRINDVLVAGYSISIHFRNAFERAVDSTLEGLVRKLKSQTKRSPALALAKEMVQAR